MVLPPSIFFYTQERPIRGFTINGSRLDFWRCISVGRLRLLLPTVFLWTKTYQCADILFRYEIRYITGNILFFKLKKSDHPMIIIYKIGLFREKDILLC